MVGSSPQMVHGAWFGGYDLRNHHSWLSFYGWLWHDHSHNWRFLWLIRVKPWRTRMNKTRPLLCWIWSRHGLYVEYGDINRVVKLWMFIYNCFWYGGLSQLPMSFDYLVRFASETSGWWACFHHEPPILGYHGPSNHTWLFPNDWYRGVVQRSTITVSWSLDDKKPRWLLVNEPS